MFSTEQRSGYIWVLSNDLILNVNKTKYMLLSTRSLDNYNRVILLNGREVERVNSFKFLGVFIANKLNFRDHIGSIYLKVSRSIAILRSMNFFPLYILVTLYYSIIYPHYIYGIFIWGTVCSTSLLSLTGIDKKNIDKRLVRSYLQPI